MHDSHPLPEAVYRQRCAEFGAQAAIYERRSNRNGNVNLLLFVAGAAGLALAFWRREPLYYALAAVLALAFIVSLVHHDRVNTQLRRYRTLLAINREGLARLARDWAALPAAPANDPAAGAAPGTSPSASGWQAGPGPRPAAHAVSGVPDHGVPDDGLSDGRAPDGDAPDGGLPGVTVPSGTLPRGIARADGADGSGARVDAGPGSQADPRADQEAGQPGLDAGRPTLDGATAADLDLLGHASLQQLLGTPNTPVGQATLRRWILEPAAAATARERQGTAAELAPQIDWRDEVCLHGRLMGPAQANYERLIAWAEGGRWLHARPWLIWAARLLALLALGLLAAQLAGINVLPALLAALLANAALTVALGRRIGEEIEEVAARQDVFQAYAEIFDLIAGRQFNAPGLRRLQAQLAAGGLSAGRQMRRLARLMPVAELRHWMFFFIIEIPTLWSFHLLWLLENWQATAGANLRAWLAGLGEAEALIALATLHHDHPGWAFPELAEGGPVRLAARDLAHPLLPPGRAVGNDVTVGPPGTFLLVTGSNMSGKSTLLRSLGVNTILAQMGGPVCAAQMQLTPLTVASSMRVQDSLQQGVSSYMAELRRLKAVVDLADRRQPEYPVLFLLDEILQGTNTAERQIAARRIIAHLVKTGAIGAVSTHDLALADAPEIAAASQPVHFSESFTPGPAGPTMTFDYRLRPGIATSTNALKLMELVGLPLDS